MRPYFAPVSCQARPAQPRQTVSPEALAAIADKAVRDTRRYWPGGQPAQADLQGLARRLGTWLDVPQSEIETALSNAL